MYKAYQFSFNIEKYFIFLKTTHMTHEPCFAYVKTKVQISFVHSNCTADLLLWFCFTDCLFFFNLKLLAIFCCSTGQFCKTWSCWLETLNEICNKFLFQKTSWQPRFIVLYSGSSDSHPHIELYDSQEKFNETKEANKKCDKKIDLNRVKYINKSTQKSSSGVDHIIEIQCKKDKHVFSVDNEYEFNDWDYRLNKVVIVLPEKGRENSSHTDPDNGDEVVTANMMYEQTSEGMSQDFTVYHLVK